MPLPETCGLLKDARANRCTLPYGHGGRCHADTRAPAPDPIPQPVRRSRILAHIDANPSTRAEDALSRLAADQEAWRVDNPASALPQAASGLFFCGRVGAPLDGTTPVCSMDVDHEGECWH